MASATLTLSAAAPPGYKFTVFSSPNISDTPSVAFGQSPTVVTTDMVIFQEYARRDGATTSLSITISTNGMPTIFAASASDSLSFLFFFWDESTSAYGTTATYTINEFTAGVVPTYTAKHFFDWIWKEAGTVGIAGAMNERVYKYLRDLGFTGSNNSMLFDWLRDRGHTGALPDMIAQFERENTTRYG